MTGRTHGKLLIALCLAAGQAGAAGGEEGDGLRELAPTSILQGESEAIGFGKTVALAGRRALVADPPDNAAYIFERDHVTGNWSQTAKLVADDDRDILEFGSRVAFSGTRALLRAEENPGVIIPPGDVDSWTYVFELQDGSWQQVATLSAGGWGVSLAGDRALIRAPESGGDNGAVAVYERIDGDWLQTALLEPVPGTIPESMVFGGAVSQSGDRVAVSAVRNPVIPTNTPGMVITYERQSDGEWMQTNAFSASDAIPNGDFGSALSMQGGKLVVGAPAFTVDQDRGAVYVFEQATGAWTETAKLVPPDDQEVAHFGVSVSLSSDQVLVGVRDVLGDEWPIQGTAYLFDYEGEAWHRSARLLPPEPSGLGFGSSVALSVGRALIGEPSFTDEAYIYEGLGNSPVKPVPALGARAMTLLLLAMTAIAAAMIQRNKRAPRNAR